MAIPEPPAESTEDVPDGAGPDPAPIPVPAPPVEDLSSPVEDHPSPAAEAVPVVEVGIADGVERPLDLRAVVVERIANWLVVGPILAGLWTAILLVVSLVDALPGWGAALLLLGGSVAVVVLSLVAHRRPVIAHRHTAYKVDGRGIEIRRGILWRKMIHVPRSRVQHTDVSQGPLERKYDLATLILYTAGTSYARVDLHGLDHATALRIRDYFVSSEGDDAV